MSDVRDPDRDQVAPTPQDPTKVQPAHDRLIEMLEERKAFGFSKYQSYLQGGNGRNPLLDIIEELMDASVYVITAMQEEDDSCPMWAKEIIDAHFNQEPINFHGCYVPESVQRYLEGQL